MDSCDDYRSGCRYVDDVMNSNAIYLQYLHREMLREQRLPEMVEYLRQCFKLGFNLETQHDYRPQSINS